MTPDDIGSFFVVCIMIGTACALDGIAWRKPRKKIEETAWFKPHNASENKGDEV